MNQERTHYFFPVGSDDGPNDTPLEDEENEIEEEVSKTPPKGDPPSRVNRTRREPDSLRYPPKAQIQFK